MLLMAALLVACHPAAAPAKVAKRLAPDHEESTPPRQTGASVADDPFADFRSAVTRHFTPVAEHFALRTVAERTIYPEMYMEFRGPTAKITVAHELESGTWVSVTVTTAGGHERGFGLHAIVEAQTRSANSFSELTKLDDLDAKVRVLADLTREHAGSLLKERTVDLRKLHFLSQRALRERERTEMGYDRALEPRPALAELFQACEASRHAICSYAAVVDYSYSTEDVAAFLKVGESDVQRMITQHDIIR